MKINGSQVNPVSQVYVSKVRQAQAASGPEAPRPKDSVELSTDAGAVAAAREVIAGTPDVREDKVAALRQQIADGTYQVKADEIAEKILTEARLSKLGQQ